MRYAIHLMLLMLMLVGSVASADDRVIKGQEGFDPKSLPLFTEGKLYAGKYETGLYPGGRNEMPLAHREAGLRLAQSIRPLDRNGEPDEQSGRIVAVVKGHSNATLYFTALQQVLKEHAAEVNERFVFVIGSVAGQQLPEILRLEGPVWEKSRRYIERAGCTNAQVQVLFLHTTSNGPGDRGGNGPPPPPFPQSMRQMQADVAKVLAHCVKIYPNLRIAYLTTDGLRHYTGMEPYVWREAFGVKWLIESQIKGENGTAFDDRAGEKRVLPWLCWGPYIWDSTWDRSKFRDGVHPTPEVCREVAEKYWKHLKDDPVARPWLYGPQGQLLQGVKPQGDAPVLQAGNNGLQFRCETAATSLRAYVTAITQGKPSSP